MKSIKKKILIPALLTMVIALTISAGFSAYMNYKSTMNTLDQTMTEAVKIAANQTNEATGKMTAVLVEFADTARLKNASLSSAEKQAVLDEKLKLGYFESIGMTDLKGVTFTGTNLADRDYIQYCITEKKPYITDPFYSEALKKMTLVVSAPAFENGQVMGVVYAVMDANYLSSITNNINVGESGNAYMLNKEGVTIAYNDAELVLSRYNTQENAKTDATLVALAALEAKMVAGETGFGTYSYGGVEKLMAYAPVPSSNGWSITITAAKSEFMNSTIIAIVMSIALLIISLLLATIILVRIASGIAKPIKNCADRLAKLAAGDLSSPVAHVDTKDETGVLSASTESIVGTLNAIITDESYILGEMSTGNFDVRTRIEDKYVGDFNAILLSIRNINNNLTQTLSKINESADQVTGGAEQVSSGAQALSQGATEQASSIEELSATINEISEQVRKNAENAANAKNTSMAAANEVTNGNRQMQQMTAAMAEIAGTSGQIGKIIKTIDDIAFQTNILALNAAVEAARAGAAGKGFAVVADEVRNLAQKSAQAAKNTTELIESSIKAVAKGTEIAENTAKSLNSIVEGTQMSTDLIQKIAEASHEQANAISQVMVGVDQISSVVQTNSATAEQSAASSEELNGQAQMLKTLVGTFKLKRITIPTASPQKENEVDRSMAVQGVKEKNSTSKY